MLFDRLRDINQVVGDNKVAATDGNAEITYRALLQHSSGFCDKLKEGGLAPGARVGVLLENSIEFLVAAFAIWKAHCVVVPLNVQLSQGEQGRYISAAKVSALVTAENLCQWGGDWREHIPYIGYAGSGSSVWVREGYERKPRDISSQNMRGGICQFSTGSTGAPKCVQRTQAQLLIETQAVGRALSVTPSDRILGALPFFHCYGLICAALLGVTSGATLCILRRYSPSVFIDAIDKLAITGLPGTPLMFQHLAETRASPNLGAVRYAVSAGVSLPLETAKTIADRYGVVIQSQYGSTETGIISLSERGVGPNEPGCVGRPLPEVEIKIFGQDGSTMSLEREGAIGVRSPYAASGYENSSRGYDSYFSNGWFYPGDKGVVTADGRLLLRGRNPRFINVGGQKVDPTEVEAVLLECRNVVEVAVLGVADDSLGEVVKAVLVGLGELTEAMIRDHCKGRLAAYKHPSIIEFKEQLPKSPLGKVLRKYMC